MGYDFTKIEYTQHGMLEFHMTKMTLLVLVDFFERYSRFPPVFMYHVKFDPN